MASEKKQRRQHNFEGSSSKRQIICILSGLILLEPVSSNMETMDPVAQLAKYQVPDINSSGVLMEATRGMRTVSRTKWPLEGFMIHIVDLVGITLVYAAENPYMNLAFPGCELPNTGHLPQAIIKIPNI